MNKPTYPIGTWVKVKGQDFRFKVEDVVFWEKHGERCMDHNHVYHPAELLEPDNPQELKNVTCPQCKRDFVLCWDDYRDNRQTLVMRGCPSGGIYDVSIHCPHCDYEEEL